MEKVKIPMVSSNGVTCVFGISACIVRMYSLTWAKAYVWCNSADGGGVGFRINSKRLRKTKTIALIMCLSCNVSKSPNVLMHMNANFLVVFLTTSCRKGQTPRSNKKICQTTILEGLDVNWDKGICKVHYTSTWRAYGIWCYEQGHGKPK